MLGGDLDENERSALAGLKKRELAEDEEAIEASKVRSRDFRKA